MSNLLVDVICEGQTEVKFIKEVLGPYLLLKGINMIPILISKKGQKGGDVRFCRAINDIGNSLQKRSSPLVSTFVDYYGIKEWPGKDNVLPHSTPEQIANTLNQATKDAICAEYDVFNPQNRFIPFVMVHEFEALLFSNSEVLARNLHVNQEIVDFVLSECGSPERINNSPLTAPAKRLELWCNGQYGKTTEGIAIAKEIGVDRMRMKCPLFDAWLLELEQKAIAQSCLA